MSQDSMSPSSGKIWAGDEVVYLADLIDIGNMTLKVSIVSGSAINAIVSAESLSGLTTQPNQLSSIRDGKGFYAQQVITLLPNQAVYYTYLTGNVQTRFQPPLYTIDAGNVLITYHVDNAYPTGDVALTSHNLNHNMQTTKLAANQLKAFSVQPTQELTVPALSHILLAGNKTFGDDASGIPIENILLPNTKYVIKIKNNTNADTQLSIRTYWIEDSL